MAIGEIPRKVGLLVVGAGPGGYQAAIRAAQLGLEVLCVDAQDWVGGTCLHAGCIPSKALIQAAELARRARENPMGVVAEGVRVDLEKLRAWKAGIVRELDGGVRQLFKAVGVAYAKARATLRSPHEAALSDGAEGTVEFGHCILATGSRPAELRDLPFDGERIVSSTKMLEVADVPRRLLVVGAGYIGMELASAYRVLGSEVTVVEILPQILPGTDKDIADVVSRAAKESGIRILVGSRVKGVERRPEGLLAAVETPQGEERIEAERCLVAVGRRPNSQGIGLAEAGVAADDKGVVWVDVKGRTSQENVFAIGDLVPGPMLAHKAAYEGKVAAEVIAGEPSAKDATTIPAVLFTHPEVAYCGLSEEEAKERGHEVATGRCWFRTLGRAKAGGETAGFVKIVADKGTGTLLGVRMVGPVVTDLVGEAVLAVETGAQVRDIALSVHPHPTFCEALMEAAEACEGRSVHQPKAHRR